MIMSGQWLSLWMLKMLLLTNPLMLTEGEGFVFECTLCGGEFVVVRDDWEVLQSSMGPYGVTKNCPLCQGRAICTIPCAKCRANILRPQDNICPDCGVNIQVALAEKVRQAKARAAAQRALKETQTRPASGPVDQPAGAPSP